MSNPSITGLSLTSPVLNTIGQKVALFGSRAYSLFQNRFIAGITLVVATVASFFIGVAVTSKFAIECEDIMSDTTSSVLCVLATSALIAAVNVEISRRLQLPLGRLSSISISMVTLAAASIGFTIHGLI